MTDNTEQYDYNNMASLEDGNEFFETVLGGLAKVAIMTHLDNNDSDSDVSESSSDSDTVSTDYNYSDISDSEIDKSDVSELSDSPYIQLSDEYKEVDLESDIELVDPDIDSEVKGGNIETITVSDAKNTLAKIIDLI
jgi:hypothetical protein